MGHSRGLLQQGVSCGRNSGGFLGLLMVGSRTIKGVGEDLLTDTLGDSSPQGPSVDWKWGGRMWWVRSELAAGEARKAEGASCTQPLTPRPPDLTESKAKVQAASSRSMLVMSLTMDLRVSSYLCRLRGEEAG